MYDGPLVEWAQEHIPHAPVDNPFGPCSAIGLEENGQIKAVIVYHEYRPVYGTCEISMAAVTPRWAQKGIIRALLSVPFEQYGCQLIYTTTPAENTRAIRFNLGIGFTKEATLRRRNGRDGDVVLCSMADDEFFKRYGHT